MDLQFYDLIGKISPCYIVILFGYLVGKYLNVDRTSVANLLFYVVVPVVFLTFGMRVKMHPDFFILPVLLFCIGMLLNKIYFTGCRLLWRNSGRRANLIGYSAGTANAGYVGLPIALMLFDIEIVAVYMFMNIGMSFYDYSYSAYTVARGQFGLKEAIKNVFKLPILWSFFLGLTLNYCNIVIPANLEPLVNSFSGAYAILGMIIIGLGMAAITKFKFNWTFILILLSSRFIASPLVMLFLVALDSKVFYIFDHAIHQAAILISVMPPAVNTVIYATIYHTHVEEAASSVFIGTLISLIYLPLVISILF